MLKYTIKRILLLIPTLFIVLTIAAMLIVIFLLLIAIGGFLYLVLGGTLPWK